MPEYRQGTVKGGSQLAGVSKFLNLKRVFDDAVRQNQWQMQHTAQQQASEERRTRIGAGAQMVGYGSISPEQYNTFVNQGQLPGGNELPPGQISQAEELSNAGIPLEQQQDYRTVPQTYVYRGRAKTINKFERKKDLSQKTTEDIAAITSSASDLKKNLETLNQKKFNSGPGISTRGGAIGDIAAQLYRGPEFTSWKSDVGRAFQKYRKWATGVAAGYPELSLLAPNFPKTTDTPKVFTTKTLSAIDDMERNQKIFLDYLNKSGYAVSQYQTESGQINEGDDEYNKYLQAIGAR